MIPTNLQEDTEYSVSFRKIENTDSCPKCGGRICQFTTLLRKGNHGDDPWARHVIQCSACHETFHEYEHYPSSELSDSKIQEILNQWPGPRRGKKVTTLEDVTRAIKDVHSVQGYDGNWNYDPYMQGLYNGLELALAIAEGRSPEFKSAPSQWVRDNDTVYTIGKEEK